MKNHDNEPKIPMDRCITRRIYRIKSRNLRFGVYDGQGGFIGIREKFSDRYLFTEYHWDQGPPHGTVYSQVDLGIDLPPDIPLEKSLGMVDQKTNRPIDFDKPIFEGGRGWFFMDTNEASAGIFPMDVPNKALFEFLEQIEKENGYD